MKAICSYWRPALTLLCVIAILLSFPRLTGAWRRNGGSLEVIHNDGVMQLLSDASDKRARSARVTLLYLDLTEQAIRLGDLETARAFWESALAQDYHNSGDFLVRQRAFSLGRRLGGVERSAVLGMGKFAVDKIIELIDQGTWPLEPAHVMEIATKQGWGTPELYVHMADSYLLIRHYQAALDLLNLVRQKYPSAEWPYLKMGQIQEMWASAGSDSVSLLENSLASYERAYQLAPSRPFAVDRLIQVNKQLGRHGQAEQWKDVLVAQLSVRQPQYPMNQQVNEEWTLMGYDLPEELLMLGDSAAPICLWWSHVGGSDLWRLGGYRLSDGILVQCYQVTNLVRNGGFELDGRTGTMFPMGFESDWYEIDYDVPLEVHHLSPDPIGERSGNLAWLSNTADDRYTSFQSDRIVIDPNAVYLQAAYVRTPDGYAYLGRLWLKDGFYFNGYSYVASGSPDTWTHWAGLAFPPPGTIAAQIWLVNYENEGTAYFDNVLLVKVGLPWDSD